MLGLTAHPTLMIVDVNVYEDNVSL